MESILQRPCRPCSKQALSLAKPEETGAPRCTRTKNKTMSKSRPVGVRRSSSGMSGSGGRSALLLPRQAVGGAASVPREEPPLRSRPRNPRCAHRAADHQRAHGRVPDAHDGKRPRRGCPSASRRRRPPAPYTHAPPSPGPGPGRALPQNRSTTKPGEPVATANESAATYTPRGSFIMRLAPLSASLPPSSLARPKVLNRASDGLSPPRAPRRPRRGGWSPAAAPAPPDAAPRSALVGQQGVGRGRQPRSGKSQLHDDENVSKRQQACQCTSGGGTVASKVSWPNSRAFITLSPSRLKIGRGRLRGRCTCWQVLQASAQPGRAAPSISPPLHL